MKKVLALVLMVLFMFGCSPTPSDEVIKKLVMGHEISVDNYRIRDYKLKEFKVLKTFHKTIQNEDWVYAKVKFRYTYRYYANPHMNDYNQALEVQQIKQYMFLYQDNSWYGREGWY